MFEIDQDELCKYCMENDETVSKETCEGCYCEIAREAYIEDMGLIEVDPETKTKTFGSLIIGDKVYLIYNMDPIPSIGEKTINSLSQMNEYLTIHFDSTSTLIKDKNSNRHLNIFLNKADCEKELKRICIERIVLLAKIIGGLKK